MLLEEGVARKGCSLVAETRRPGVRTAISPAAHRHGYFFVGLGVAIALTAFAVDIATPPGVAVGVFPYFLVVLLTAWMPWRLSPLVALLGCSALTLIGYAMIEGVPGPIILINRLFIIFAMAIMTFLVMLRNKADRALADQRAGLEHLVVERTAELSERNVALEREIESRQRSCAALEVRERQFSRLVEFAPTPVLILSRDAEKIIYANPEARRVLELDPSDFGQRELTDYLVKPEEALQIRDALQENPGTTHTAFTFSLVDGNPMEATILHAPVEFRGSAAFCVMLHDVSQHLAAIRELKQAKRQAEAASAAKSRFLANMSHELRTPLNAIIGFSDVMLKEIHGPLGSGHYAEYCRDIHDSGHYLLNLLQSVLEESQLEDGSYHLREQVVAVAEVVRRAVHMIRTEAAKSKIEIVLNCAPMLSDLRCDPLALQQIVLNLMSNAVKFSPDGSIIKVKLWETGGAIRLQVLDHGVGIAAEELETVLRPFERGAETHNSGVSGVGLGLSISKALVELHDAEMTISSAPGDGTAITISFPAARSYPRQNAALSE